MVFDPRDWGGARDEDAAIFSLPFLLLRGGYTQEYVGAESDITQEEEFEKIRFVRAQDADFEDERLVMSAARGSFTAGGASQAAVLYIMSPWPRFCPKMGLALIEGGRLVVNWGFEGTAHALVSAGDVNSDGRDELVFTGEFGMGGQVSRSVTLTTFGAAGPEDIGVASFHDTSSLDDYAPSLIRAVQQSYKMGELATRLLLEEPATVDGAFREIVIPAEFHLPGDESLGQQGVVARDSVRFGSF